MLLYEDIITGDEMFSDAFPMCVSLDVWLMQNTWQGLTVH